MTNIARQLDLETVKKVLSQHQTSIQNLDVSSLSLFGSTIKKTATANSDLDFLVEFTGKITFDKYMNLKFFLEDLFSKPVDLVVKTTLKPEIRQAILEEAINVT